MSTIRTPTSILITGATGMIGAHIAYDLTRNGETVRAIKRPGSTLAVIESIFHFYSKDAIALLKKIEWLDADLLDLGALEEAMKGITHVYHCGAMVSFKPKERDLMLAVNIEGTANIINIAIDNKISKFCHISSVAALGHTTDGGLINEDTWWKNDPDNSWYAISKYGAEREVWRATEEGLDVVIVNPSLVITPGAGKSSSEAFQVLKKGMKWYTDGIIGLVDARDVSDAAIRLMRSEIRNERFIVSATNLNYRDFFDRMLVQFGRPKTKWKATPFLLSLGWRAEKWLAKLRGRSPRVTKETAISALEKNRYDGNKICRSVDFQYRDIDTTIKEIAVYYN